MRTALKRCFVIVMILAMLLPAVSLASDQDQIVGTWYVYSGIIEDPELKEQAYYEISTFHFATDGTVFSSTYDISEEGITTVKDFKAIGLWTKEGNTYYVNVEFNGAVELKFDKDDIFFPVSDYSIRLHKMKLVNYALDIRR